MQKKCHTKSIALAVPDCMYEAKCACNTEMPSDKRYEYGKSPVQQNNMVIRAFNSRGLKVFVLVGCSAFIGGSSVHALGSPLTCVLIKRAHAAVLSGRWALTTCFTASKTCKGTHGRSNTSMVRVGTAEVRNKLVVLVVSVYNAGRSTVQSQSAALLGCSSQLVVAVYP